MNEAPSTTGQEATITRVFDAPRGFYDRLADQVALR